MGLEVGEVESSWRRSSAALVPFHESKVPTPSPLGTGERRGQREGRGRVEEERKERSKLRSGTIKAKNEMRKKKY